MEKVKESKNIQETLNYKLIEACKIGDLEQVRYLLTSSELFTHANIHASINEESEHTDLIKHYSEEPLFQACKNGHLNIVKYLLSDPELKEYAKINTNDRFHSALLSACRFNHIEVVKYLLSSEDLNEHAKPDYGYDNVLNIALRFNNFEIAKYLLTEEKLKNKINISDNRKLSYKTTVKIPYTNTKTEEVGFIEINDDFHKSAFATSCSGHNLEAVKFLLQFEELKNTRTLIEQENICGNVSEIFERVFTEEYFSIIGEKDYQEYFNICEYLIYEYRGRVPEYQAFLLENKAIRATMERKKLTEELIPKNIEMIKRTKI